MGVPIVDILNEKVHLEVLNERGLIEGLQQKGSLAMPYIRQILGGPWDLEADSRLELLRSLEVACRDKGLGFDSGQIHARNCDCFRAMWPHRSNIGPWPSASLHPLDRGNNPSIGLRSKLVALACCKHHLDVRWPARRLSKVRGAAAEVWICLVPNR
jgi:hypothetical protein